MRSQAATWGPRDELEPNSAYKGTHNISLPSRHLRPSARCFVACVWRHQLITPCGLDRCHSSSSSSRCLLVEYKKQKMIRSGSSETNPSLLVEHPVSDLHCTAQRSSVPPDRRMSMVLARPCEADVVDDDSCVLCTYI